MTNKYQNKYRISSTRLQNWDYGWNAPYFVTICTQNREYYFGDIVETPKLGVSIIPQSQPQPQTAAASQKWKPATLGVIINQYKRICTINARRIHADFAWQPRFHDQIIRNNLSYQRIKNYIIENPLKWNDDKFNGGEA